MERRDELLRAAATVYARYGYRGSTTRRIADEAHVNEVTIFRQFGSKDALLQEAVASAGGAPEIPDLPADPIDPAAELLVWSMALFQRVQATQPLLRRCLSEQEEHPQLSKCGLDVHARSVTVVRNYLTRLRDRGLTDQDADPETASTMLTGALFADAMKRDRMPHLFSVAPNMAVERYIQMLLRAIGAESPSPSLS